MHRLIVPTFCALLLTSCGSDRSDVSNATTGGKGQGDLSSESFQYSLMVYLDRLRQRVTNTSTEIQVHNPDNAARRMCLLWQIRTTETMMGAAHQKNLVVALVQTWYWTASMEKFFSIGRGKELFGTHQQLVITVSQGMRASSEELAGRYLPPKQFQALKTDIEAAVGNGDLFAATSSERSQTMDKILNATRLEGVLGIALSPFEAMSGVGKGADALKDMTVVGNRAIDLAERYPEMIGWYLQLAALEIQEQDAVHGALADVHAMSETARDLPERIRKEAETLLAASGPVQADTRATLDKVRDASTAVEHAGTAIDQSIRSLDTFVTNAKGPPAKPGDPVGEPFRIQDYTAVCQAAEGAAKQITAALQALSQAVQSPETRAQIEGIMRDADVRIAKARTESETLLAAARIQADQLIDKAGSDAQVLIDHAAKRIAQLLVLLTALVAGAVIVVRMVRNRR